MSQTLCRWSTCTAAFLVKEDFYPHFSRSHGNNNYQKQHEVSEILENAKSLLSLNPEVDINHHTQTTEIECKWTRCEKKYHDFEELVSHVTTDHVSPTHPGKRI
jgi:hypothetical protein